MENKKNIILLISLVIIVGAGFWYYKKRQQLPQTPFKTEAPKRMDLVQFVEASGTLKAKDQISVGSLVAGKVIQILVDNNDFVKKDQVLAILDNGIGDSDVKKIKAVLEETQAKLTYEEKFYKRQKELFKSGQLAKDQFEQYTRDLETLKAQIKQAQAELELSTKEYENLWIKSPDTGVVIAKEVDLGQMVTSQLDATVLFVIAKDLHEMEAQVDVDEADVGIVQDGQDATFTVDSFPKLKFNAKVEKIRYLAKNVDNVVTYAIILKIKNPELKLRPGMTTNVDIKVADSRNALVVPNKALRINSSALEDVAKILGYDFERLPNTTSKTIIDEVWILVDNAKFKQVKVAIGAKEGAVTQITADDIKDNTQIVTEVADIKRENVVLKIFKQPGGIGK